MRNAVALSLIVLCVAAGGALASEIYRWTDDEGNVHYGDRPTGEARDGATRVAIVSRRTDDGAVRAGIDARHEREARRAESRAAAAEAAAAAAEEQRAAEERARQCAGYRERLEKYVTSRRLYRVDDDGERTYLDEEQMRDARAKLQARIEETCTN